MNYSWFVFSCLNIYVNSQFKLMDFVHKAYIVMYNGIYMHTESKSDDRTNGGKEKGKDGNSRCRLIFPFEYILTLGSFEIVVQRLLPLFSFIFLEFCGYIRKLFHICESLFICFVFLWI